MIILICIISSILSFATHTDNDYIITQASWYGNNFHGRPTANGEIYNQNELVAASPHLPFNTIVKIINIDNNKSVIVRINDRGPFKMDKNGCVLFPLVAHPKRGFDLSKKSFSVISNLDKGVIKIKYLIM